MSLAVVTGALVAIAMEEGVVQEGDLGEEDIDSKGIIGLG